MVYEISYFYCFTILLKLMQKYRKEIRREKYFWDKMERKKDIFNAYAEKPRMPYEVALQT